MIQLLRSAAMLALFTSGTSVYGWDEPVADEAPAETVETPPVAPIDGRSIFSVPVLQKRWEAQAVLNVTRDKVAFITADEDVVIVQSTAGTVTVFNAESGRQLWSARVGQMDEVAMRATTDSQLIAIVSGPVLHGFDKFSGKKLFGFRLPISASAEPLLTRREVMVGDVLKVTRTVFIPLNDQSIVAYDLETLRHLGQRGVLPKGKASPQLWRFASGELTVLPPVSGFAPVVFVTEDGNLIAVQMTGARAGKLNFQLFMNSQASAPLTAVTRDDRDYILAAFSSKRLYCVEIVTAPGTDIINGELRWEFPLSRAISKPIVCVGNEAFVVTAENEMYKFDLKLGQPVQVSNGTRTVLTQSERNNGEIPAYGTAINIAAKGRLLLNPISISNSSTGQVITTVQFNLGTCPSLLKFAVNEDGKPIMDLAGDRGVESGFRKAEVSEDRRSVTLTFSDFKPGEEFQFLPQFEHDELEMADVTDAHLANADVRATVSPVRASVASSDVTGAEPLSPRLVIGRMKEVTQPWKVTGVDEILAVSESSVFFSDPVNNIVSVGRASGLERIETRGEDFTIHVANDKTDRIFMCTTNGRVICHTESRIELSLMPIPVSGALLWVPFPKAELTPEFAMFHQNPNRQPVMPDVPQSDPVAPAESAEEPTEK